MGTVVSNNGATCWAKMSHLGCSLPVYDEEGWSGRVSYGMRQGNRSHSIVTGPSEPCAYYTLSHIVCQYHAKKLPDGTTSRIGERLTRKICAA